MPEDTFVIDPETRVYIAALGWTPRSDYVVAGGGGYVLCTEGQVWYINSDGTYQSYPKA